MGEAQTKASNHTVKPSANCGYISKSGHELPAHNLLRYQSQTPLVERAVHERVQPANTESKFARFLEREREKIN